MKSPPVPPWLSDAPNAGPVLVNCANGTAADCEATRIYSVSYMQSQPAGLSRNSLAPSGSPELPLPQIPEWLSRGALVWFSAVTRTRDLDPACLHINSEQGNCSFLPDHINEALVVELAVFVRPRQYFNSAMSGDARHRCRAIHELNAYDRPSKSKSFA